MPNLGVVQAGVGALHRSRTSLGLIPGASKAGKGLGLEFLRHIERTAVIVHVLDCATLSPAGTRFGDLDVHRGGARGLPTRRTSRSRAGGCRSPSVPRLVVLNKINVPEARDLAELVAGLEARGLRVFEISTASHEGLRPLTYALAELVEKARAEAPAPEPTRVVLRPRAVDEAGFTVKRKGGATDYWFEVRGAKPESTGPPTDFSNDEAVGYLADRLARLGVEDKLYEAGAVAGDEVRIGSNVNAVIFDWEPTLMSGSELLGGPRGSDNRLDESLHPTRSEKQREHHERMDAKAEARRELWTERQAGTWTDPRVRLTLSPTDPESSAPTRAPFPVGDRALSRARVVLGAARERVGPRRRRPGP